jgi:hypothetical protein
MGRYVTAFTCILCDNILTNDSKAQRKHWALVPERPDGARDQLQADRFWATLPAASDRGGSGTSHGS